MQVEFATTVAWGLDADGLITSARCQTRPSPRNHLSRPGWTSIELRKERSKQPKLPVIGLLCGTPFAIPFLIFNAVSSSGGGCSSRLLTLSRMGILVKRSFPPPVVIDEHTLELTASFFDCNEQNGPHLLSQRPTNLSADGLRTLLWFESPIRPVKNMKSAHRGACDRKTPAPCRCRTAAR